MTSFTVPHVFGKALALSIKGTGTPRVTTFQSYAALRDGAWYPGVRTLHNDVFVTGQEWELSFEDERIALTFALDFAKTMYDHELKGWQAFVENTKLLPPPNL
jgi:hypothetical protein